MAKVASTIDKLKAIATATKDVDRSSNKEVECEEKAPCEGLAVPGLQIDQVKAINDETPMVWAELE